MNPKIKIIYFTDVHLFQRGGFRSDNFLDAQLKKLDKLIELKHNSNAEKTFLVCGGDLFDFPITHISPHSQKVNMDTIVNVVSRLHEIDLCVLGNHDYSHEPGFEKQLNKSFVGVLYQFMNYHGIDYNTFGFSLKIGTHHWKADKMPVPIYNKKNTTDDSYSFLITHESLTWEKKPFETVLMKDFHAPGWDYILTADIHEYQGTNEINGQTFISPGSLCRLDSGQKTKKPKYAVIDIMGNGTKPIIIYHDILDKNDNVLDYWVDVRKVIQTREKHETAKKVFQLDEIDDLINSDMFSSCSIDKLIQEQGKDHFSPDEIEEMVKL